MLRSIIVFAIAYAVIASGRLHKAVAAILAGCLLIGIHGVGQDAAFEAIDLNVIFLLMGMMILVHVVAETGLFQCVAIYVAKVTDGNPVKIIVALVAVTAILSAVLDNVTTVLLMAPVTILIADSLEIPPTPFLILEVIGSNIGGTATLVGDPPNLLIGSRVGLSFNQFLWHLGPAVLLCIVAMSAVIWFVFRRRLYVPADIRARLRDSEPAAALANRRDAIIVCGVMGLVLLGFFLHAVLDVEPSVIALGGAMMAVIMTRKDVEDAFGAVEWTTLMFFIGLFILVAGLEEHGVLDLIAGGMVAITKGHWVMMLLLVMWGSAAASAIVDNIPFVAAMIPVLEHATQKMSLAPDQQQAVWWALALGACLGGNATLVGASANVVMAGVAEKHGHKIGFGQFMRYGLPSAVGSLAICSLYIWLRYT